MDRNALARHIVDASYLKGKFTLRSGQISDRYFDKYQFESRPELLRAIAEAMAELVPTDTEVLAGLELGGVPIATVLSILTDLPVVFVRKARKDYGTGRITEGVAIEGRRVCIIEDVITTGGQVALSARDLRADRALVNTAICAIYRGEGDPAIATDPSFAVRSLFTARELVGAEADRA